LKGRQLAKLNEELSSKLPHSFETPHIKLQELRKILAFFESAIRLKEKYKIEHGFVFTLDFVGSVYQMLTLSVPTLDSTERKAVADTLVLIEKFLHAFTKTAKKLEVNRNSVFSYCDNALTRYPDAQFEMLLRYLELKYDLQKKFSALPNYNYAEETSVLEELVTTQMTYKMDGRVVDFYENSRADAKDLASIISKKQKFDKASFAKLKEHSLAYWRGSAILLNTFHLSLIFLI
jgi:hypothetical protein